MGEKTKIAWTDRTFNPWRGCVQASEGCKNCYAEHNRAVTAGCWGKNGVREKKKIWAEVKRWNRQAMREGQRIRVFCASLADVFEDHPSIPDQWRIELWELIRETLCLDWQILTKRPENFERFLPWMGFKDHMPEAYGSDTPWSNVWLGVSTENQACFDQRVPILRHTPAAIRFISAEPQLEAIQFDAAGLEGIHWYIAGGESAAKAVVRAFDPDWARMALKVCREARVAFFMKQLGTKTLPKGQMADPAFFPEDLRVREWPKEIGSCNLGNNPHSAILLITGGSKMNQKFKKDQEKDTTFTEIMSYLMPEDVQQKTKAEEAIKGIENALSSDGGSFKACIEGCRNLLAATECEPQKLFKVLKKAVKKNYSTSFLACYLHAVKIAAEYPVLTDIIDKERLSIIARIPEDQHASVISDGNISGVDIRTSERKALRHAVAELNGKKVQQSITEQSAGFARSLSALAARIPIAEYTAVHGHLCSAIAELEKTSKDASVGQLTPKIAVSVGFNDDDADEYAEDDESGFPVDPNDEGTEEEADSPFDEVDSEDFSVSETTRASGL